MPDEKVELWKFIVCEQCDRPTKESTSEEVLVVRKAGDKGKKEVWCWICVQNAKAGTSVGSTTIQTR